MSAQLRNDRNRRAFIGGSDARVIMGSDEAALLRLWQQKRGEAEPVDLSQNLIVQLGIATEALNRRWYEANTGEARKDVQRWVRHPVLFWMAATLDVWSRAPRRCSRLTSCCLGPSQRKPPLKSTWRSSSTICAWS